MLIQYPILYKTIYYYYYIYTDYGYLDGTSNSNLINICI